MRLLSWTVQILILSLVVVAEEQQECEVGGDGTCIEEVPVVEALEEPLTMDKHCPDRGHIIRCTGATLDLNKNGKLERIELDTAINSLPWYGRIVWLVRFPCFFMFFSLGVHLTSTSGMLVVL
jgi:hypothetical protein